MNNQSPHQQSYRKLMLIVGAALLGLILLGVILTMTVFSGEQAKDAKLNTPYRNQLMPLSYLKVGSNGYKSPCRVLPTSSVTSLFGKLTDDSFIQEDSLSTSVPAPTTSITTECTYSISSGSFEAVSLRADQYGDKDQLKQVGMVFLVDPMDIKDTVAALKKTADGTKNRDAKEIVATLEKSLATYNKYYRIFDPAALAGFNPDGMILPVDDGTFKAIYGNVAYEFKIAPAKGNKISNADLLAKFNKAFAVIGKNGTDRKLDQSPAPTILGSTDKIGSTKILESCVILNGAVFKTLVGGEQNDVTRRVTLPVNAAKDRFGTVDKIRILPSNECERSLRTDAGKTAVNLQLRHAKSAEQAKQWLKDYRGTPGTGDTTLTTEADEAYALGNPEVPSTATYIFRVGPYVGGVSIRKVNGGSNSADVSVDTAISQDQYIQAINALVTQITKQR